MDWNEKEFNENLQDDLDAIKERVDENNQSKLDNSKISVKEDDKNEEQNAKKKKVEDGVDKANVDKSCEGVEQDVAGSNNDNNIDLNQACTDIRLTSMNESQIEKDLELYDLKNYKGLNEERKNLDENHQKIMKFLNKAENIK